MSEKSLEYYIDRYINGAITAEEKAVLIQLLENPDVSAAIDDLMEEQLEQWEDSKTDFSRVRSNIQYAVEKELLTEVANGSDLKLINEIESRSPLSQNTTAGVLRKMSRLNRIGWAAAIVLLISTGVYFWIATLKASGSLEKNKVATIHPGTNKAILKLANGTTITLDDAETGAIAQQGNAQVVKLENGQIAYTLDGELSSELMLNTLMTPRGGQHMLILPDGTKVWMNAASSITYPTSFIGPQRSVSITGEVYFEVAKQKHKPFIVEINGKSTVEVLGTNFNVNAYPDEDAITSTLLEGSIKVSNHNSSTSDAASKRALKYIQNYVVLKPGQQAVSTHELSTDTAIRVHELNNNELEKATAWKSGLLNFEGADLRSVMRQLSRWYDIDVVYQGNVSNINFKGKMYRNIDFNDVLEMLGYMGVKFELKGKTLLVF